MTAWLVYFRFLFRFTAHYHFCCVFAHSFLWHLYNLVVNFTDKNIYTASIVGLRVHSSGQQKPHVVLSHLKQTGASAPVASWETLLPLRRCWQFFEIFRSSFRRNNGYFGKHYCQNRPLPLTNYIISPIHKLWATIILFISSPFFLLVLYFPFPFPSIV